MNSNMPRLWLMGVTATIVILVSASAVVALFMDRRDTTVYPEDTPQGVVQRYLQAVWEGQQQAAYGYLSDELKTFCSYQQFRDSSRRIDQQDIRVSLTGSETLNGTIEVQVRISRVHMGRPFIPDESSHTWRFVLTQLSGSPAGPWKFTEPPWPMSYCPEWDTRNSRQTTLPAG